MYKRVKNIHPRDRRRGQRIKAARLKAGYESQEALGLDMGRSRSSVARWESGEIKPDDELASLFKRLLKLDWVKDILMCP